jgi:hypothetical protein
MATVSPHEIVVDKDGSVRELVFGRYPSDENLFFIALYDVNHIPAVKQTGITIHEVERLLGRGAAEFIYADKGRRPADLDEAPAHYRFADYIGVSPSERDMAKEYQSEGSFWFNKGSTDGNLMEFYDRFGGSVTDQFAGRFKRKVFPEEGGQSIDVDMLREVIACFSSRELNEVMEARICPKGSVLLVRKALMIAGWSAGDNALMLGGPLYRYGAGVVFQASLSYEGDVPDLWMVKSVRGYGKDAVTTEVGAFRHDPSLALGEIAAAICKSVDHAEQQPGKKASMSL